MGRRAGGSDVAVEPALTLPAATAGWSWMSAARTRSRPGGPEEQQFRLPQQPVRCAGAGARRGAGQSRREARAHAITRVFQGSARPTAKTTASPHLLPFGRTVLACYLVSLT